MGYARLLLLALAATAFLGTVSAEYKQQYPSDDYYPVDDYSKPSLGYGYSPSHPVPPMVFHGKCPPCPSCADAGSSILNAKLTSSAGRKLTAVSEISGEKGQCYCPYDHDWKTWAIADESCRSALYSRCSVDPRLPCDWLDEYYTPAEHAGMRSYRKPHEERIFTYLYNDCPAAEPCSCGALKFDGNDSSENTFKCCRDLSTYCQIPFSGVSCAVVDGFCERQSNTAEVGAWVQHRLWRSSCPVARSAAGHLYNYHPTFQSQSAISGNAATRVPTTTTTSTVLDINLNAFTTEYVVALISGVVGGMFVSSIAAMAVFTRLQKVLAIGTPASGKLQGFLAT